MNPRSSASQGAPVRRAERRGHGAHPLAAPDPVERASDSAPSLSSHARTQIIVDFRFCEEWSRMEPARLRDFGRREGGGSEGGAMKCERRALLTGCLDGWSRWRREGTAGRMPTAQPAGSQRSWEDQPAESAAVLPGADSER